MTKIGEKREHAMDLRGKVALVTGGASGIGAAACRRLASHGAVVSVADVDEERGRSVADAVGGRFHRLDVTDLAANHAVVAAIEEQFGRLDIAFLNAGIVASGRDDEPLDEAAYRRILGINLDGVVFGVDAVVPAMTRNGGGHVVGTASLAGLVPMPGDALYTLTKTAVVGYVRALAPTLAARGISINALCPGFADTPMITPMRGQFDAAGFPVLTAEQVAEALAQCLAAGGTGEAWFVQPGMPAAPYRFRNVPAARNADGSHAAVPAGLGPHGARR